MNQEERFLFESLRDTYDLIFKEFENKAKYEWKFSFGIWVGIIGFLSLFIQFQVVQSSLSSYPFNILLTLIIIAIFLLHIAFVFWVNSNHQRHKTNREKCFIQIEKILKKNVEIAFVKPDHSDLFINRPSPIIQIFVTLLLSLSAIILIDFG